jgi:23S rRNA pseudouridine1911/1915/1917 synthase
MGMADQSFLVPDNWAQHTLAAALRKWLPGQPWSKIRSLITGRRVKVSGTLCLDPARRLKADEVVKLLASAAPPPPREEQVVIRHLDTHLVVIEKPANVTTIRHPEERDWPARRRQLQPTLDELLPGLIAKAAGLNWAGPAARRKGPLPRVRPVHRLDRETSGLMVFARTVEAERGLGLQFRKHTIHRRYLAIVHGRLEAARTVDTHLTRDRGDGRRGSTTLPNVGKRAITHVTPLEHFDGLTLVECKLETGRTHQIRIHLAELGHPVCGEKVYQWQCGRLAPRGERQAEQSERHAERGDHESRTVPRIMLHAAELGFVHPVTGQELRFEMPPPRDFAQFLSKLRRSKQDQPSSQ